SGKVAYKGGRGPFGFKAGEMEQALAMLLLDQAAAEPGASESKTNSEPRASASGAGVLRVALLDNETAWKKLPAADKGQGEPLPAWARALATALPRTTGAMLELDYLHRAKNPLGARLRGQVRYVAANANRCSYTQAQAAADLKRAGVSEK